jgi:hypothetical protein
MQYAVSHINYGTCTYDNSRVACGVRPDIRYFLRMFPLCVTSTFTPRRAFFIYKGSIAPETQHSVAITKIYINKGEEINQTFTRSESDNGLTEMSLLRS